jgi:hypothetical protein
VKKINSLKSIVLIILTVLLLSLNSNTKAQALIPSTNAVNGGVYPVCTNTPYPNDYQFIITPSDGYSVYYATDWSVNYSHTSANASSPYAFSGTGFNVDYIAERPFGPNGDNTYGYDEAGFNVTGNQPVYVTVTCSKYIFPFKISHEYISFELIPKTVSISGPTSVCATNPPGVVTYTATTNVPNPLYGWLSSSNGFNPSSYPVGNTEQFTVSGQNGPVSITVQILNACYNPPTATLTNVYSETSVPSGNPTPIKVTTLEPDYCPGNSINISAATVATATQYVWTSSDNAAFTLFQTTTNTPTNNVEVNQNSANSTITVQAANGCGTDIKNIGKISFKSNTLLQCGNGTGTGGKKAPVRPVPLGICPSLSVLDSDMGYNLGGENFYFAGNGLRNGSSNDVVIGNDCSYNPLGKLDVYQNSGASSTQGINVLNIDPGTFKSPSIGINSSVVGYEKSCNVAALFNASGINMSAPVPTMQTAILVPPDGGLVNIGYPLNSMLSGNYSSQGPVLLSVNSSVNAYNLLIPSDSLLYSNIAPFKQGLNVIRKLSPVVHQYNGMNGNYIGLVSQRLNNVAPYALDTSYVQSDSLGNYIAINNIDQNAIIYTTINAVKQVDSTVTRQQLSIDSLRNNLHTGGGVGGSGTANYLTSWASDSTLGNSQFQTRPGQIISGADSNHYLSLAYFDPGFTSDHFTDNYVMVNRDDVGLTNVSGSQAVQLLSNGYHARVDATGVSAPYTYNYYDNLFNDQVISGVNTFTIDHRGIGKNSLGIGTTTPGYALQVEASGNSTAAYFDGDVYTTGSYLPSDRTLKTNIDSISNCKSMLCKLKPRSFNYDSANHPGLNLPGGMQYGLIAQDVQSVLPNLVRTVVRPAFKDTAGNIVQPAVTFMGLNYTQLIPLLIKGYQDQQQTIDSLRNTLNNIQSCINSLCDSSRRHTKVSNTGSDNPDNVQNVTLTSANAAILYQNTPNPFSTGTKINYFLPEGTMGASMIFFDMYGNKLKEVALQQTGMGTLNITPDNMKDGVYSYSLVINGQLIDTKKMVLQK